MTLVLMIIMVVIGFIFVIILSAYCVFGPVVTVIFKVLIFISFALRVVREV